LFLWIGSRSDSLNIKLLFLYSDNKKILDFAQLSRELDRFFGEWGNGGMGKWGNGEMGEWGNGEMGKWGNGEMGKWGNGEMGEWGNSTKTLKP
jgi:hypothetical protein